MLVPTLSLMVALTQLLRTPPPIGSFRLSWVGGQRFYCWLLSLFLVRSLMGKVRGLPICPFDGRPCEHLGYCDVSVFDGYDSRSVFRCHRLGVGKEFSRANSR
jgi:hypothetical protein